MCFGLTVFALFFPRNRQTDPPVLHVYSCLVQSHIHPSCELCTNNEKDGMYFIYFWNCTWELCFGWILVSLAKQFCPSVCSEMKSIAFKAWLLGLEEYWSEMSRVYLPLLISALMTCFREFFSGVFSTKIWSVPLVFQDDKTYNQRVRGDGREGGGAMTITSSLPGNILMWYKWNFALSSNSALH